MADCTADARSPRSVAFTITAISAVDPTMPSAIHGASAPAVSSGLNAFDEPTPPNPPAMTAIASTTTATSMIMRRPVDRRTGEAAVGQVPVPQQEPVEHRAQERRAGHQLEEREHLVLTARPGEGDRTAIETGTLTNPTARAAGFCFRSCSAVHTSVTIELANARRTAHSPDESP